MESIKSSVYAVISNVDDFRAMFESLIWGEPQFEDFNPLTEEQRQRIVWIYETSTAIPNDQVDGELLSAAVSLVENLIEIENVGYVQVPDGNLWSTERVRDTPFDLFDFQPDRCLHAYQLRRTMYDQGREQGVILPPGFPLVSDFSKALLVRTSMSEVPALAGV